MRIAIISWSRREAGGTETYLKRIIPELLRVGHSVAFWYEIDEPVDREQIPLPDGVPAWCASDLGAKRALAALRDWHPDLIYAHGLHNPELEAETLQIAPVVFFAHNYHGTCISGAKTFKNPIVTPCSRRFGWQCLLHYYPHRCGGWSPLTMVSEYKRQSQRLKILESCSFIVTISEYMRAEYIMHGFEPERVHNLSHQPYHMCDPPYQDAQDEQVNTPLREAPLPCLDQEQLIEARIPRRLLFLGRMTFLKGGRILLDALPSVRASLDRTLHVTFAGDGPDRHVWERTANQLAARNPGLYIDFVDWVSGQQKEFLLRESDLLIVPSLWPEPYGRVGLEACSQGVPVVAFAVGGIPEWLTDGVNGHLAPGNPPTVPGLAEAIIKCLRDPSVYARLKLGAVQMAQRCSFEGHLAALGKVFETVLRCK